MNQILHQSGFLGTAANFAADMTMVLMLLSAILFTGGTVLAVQGRYQAHRWTQTAAVIISTIMVLWMMILPFRDFVLPGLPGQLAEQFYAVTVFHALVGVVALLFGLYVTLVGHGLLPAPLRFNNYKLFMRIAYGLYMLATLLGVWVYFVWFVTNPNPPTY